jgi:hypothetical protein
MPWQRFKVHFVGSKLLKGILLQPASKHKPIPYAKPDGVVSFDLLTSLYRFNSVQFPVADTISSVCPHSVMLTTISMI